jgi:hypothetical protein
MNFAGSPKFSPRVDVVLPSQLFLIRVCVGVTGNDDDSVSSHGSPVWALLLLSAILVGF